MRSAAAGNAFKPKYSPSPKYPLPTLSGSTELYRDRTGDGGCPHPMAQYLKHTGSYRITCVSGLDPGANKMHVINNLLANLNMSAN